MWSLLRLCDAFASDFSVVFNAAKSKCLWRKARSSCASYCNKAPSFLIGGNVTEFVSSLPHLGHILTTDMNDKSDIDQRKYALCGQIDDVLCYFGKRQSIVKLQLMKIYCSSFYGSVLWDLSHPAISAFCAAWRKGLRSVWGVPYCTHKSLLPVMSNYLPLLDELCCRIATFIKSCLESDSPIVSAVARYGVYYGRSMNSHLGRNAFFCCTRYAVTDVFSVTRLMIPRYVDSQISTQLRASVLSLLELLFVREGVFSCSFLSSSESNQLVDFICTA